MKKFLLLTYAISSTFFLMASSSGGVRRLCPPRVPVILVQYDDVRFKEENSAESFSEFFNGAQYSHAGASGSVQQYFKDQSFGKYVPQFDIIGPVTLEGKQKDYGENDDFGDDIAADIMVADACNLAEELADFTCYDADGDGKIDALIILYAGVGEIYGESNFDAVWAYTSNLEESDELSDYVVLDGKTVTFFSAVPELQNAQYRDGIGTVIHEFAHILGLPNMCSTDGGLQKTLGDWDVMDHGSYNDKSRTPAGMSAYERFYLGWVEPILLDGPMNVRLRDLASTGDCAIITANGQHNLNSINPDPREFYILENRQQSGWDKYLPGHGMMMTKIDYVKNKWESDIVNNVENHPCVDLIEADGSAPKYRADLLTNGYFGKQGDLFPAGATEYAMFSNKMYFSDVRETNGVILFDFLGGVEKCTVHFSVSNGTCATSSLTESKKGAGIVLPQVKADQGYTFLGWTTRKNSTIADAGQPGETFYPMSDCSLFAVMQDNTRFWFHYDIKGVVIGDYIGFNGAYIKTNNIHDVSITFARKDGYAALTPDNCLVQVECGGNRLLNAATFSEDTITLSLPSNFLTGDIYITISNVREQTEEGCAPYHHIFTSACRTGEDQELSGYNWDVTIANDNTCDYDKSKGAVFGSGSYPAGSVSLYTDETIGCAVASVTIEAAANGDAELNVYVGGNAVGESVYPEAELNTYTFLVSEPKSGPVEIRMSNTQKAMFIKSISIGFVKLEDQGEQAVENIDGNKGAKGWIKILHNGHLIIMHDNIVYTILGTRIK